MSPIMLAMLPGFRELSSCSSSSPSTSIFCGASSMRLLVRVALTTTSPSSPPSPAGRRVSNVSGPGNRMVRSNAR
ncbi:MAG: hypothetical protein QM724_04460 [Flavobacteriales bacterium]